MSQEVQVWAAIQHTSTGLTPLKMGDETSAITTDQTTKKRGKFTQNIGTTEEQIDFGDITTLGWYMIYNNDATNYVEIGVRSGGTSYYHAKVLPKKTYGPVHATASMVSAIYAKANTAACEIEIEACNT